MNSLLNLAVNYHQALDFFAQAPSALLIFDPETSSLVTQESNRAFRKAFPEGLKGAELMHKLKLGLSFKAQIPPFQIEAYPLDDNQWFVQGNQHEDKTDIQERILRLADQLNLVVENAPMVLWVVNRDNEIQLALGKRLMLWGGVKGSLEGLTLKTLFRESPDFIGQVEDAHQGQLAESTSELHGRTWETHFARIGQRDTPTEGLIGVSQDISERVKTEKKLIEAKNKAERATAAKSEFLAHMSHEIRTPLNSILGFSEIIAQQITDPALQSYTQAIRSSGNNLLQLINNLLDLSKIESGNVTLNPVWVPLQSLIQELETLFRLPAEKKGLLLHFENHFPSNLQISADVIRLKQCLVNLIGNAIKYTPQGEVTLVTQFDGTSDTPVTFAIHDTGPGICEEDQKTIFNSFVQKTTTEQGGAGLGLAITQKLIVLMKGSLGLESSVGKGSCFTLSLKLREHEYNLDHRSSPVLNLSGVVNFLNSTILYVDDNDLNRQLMRLTLAPYNLDLLEASSGKEALAMIEQAPHLSLMLIDLKMPEMDGFELLKHIQGMPGELPAIAMTARHDDTTPQRVASSGFSGYLSKPIDKTQLVQALQDYLPYEHSSRVTSKKACASEASTVMNLDIELLAELVPLAKAGEDSFIINEIQEFLEQLKQVPEATQHPIMRPFVEKLENAVNQFDIAQAQSILKTYESILDSLHATPDI